MAGWAVCIGDHWLQEPGGRHRSMWLPDTTKRVVFARLSDAEHVVRRWLWNDRQNALVGLGSIEYVCVDDDPDVGPDGETAERRRNPTPGIPSGVDPSAALIEARDLIVRNEWVDTSGEDDRCCPTCRAFERMGGQPGAHDKGCPLDAWLTKTGLPTQELRERARR